VIPRPRCSSPFRDRVRDRRGGIAPLAASIGLVLLGVATSSRAAPPTAPGLVSGNVEGDRVDLVWVAATDDVGVTGYNVYRDGDYLTTVHETRLSTTLGDGEETRFRVTAFDSPSDGPERRYSGGSPVVTFTRTASPPAAEPIPSDEDGDIGDVDPAIPTAASRLAANRLSPTRVLLTWVPASDDVGIRGYNVYRDDRYLASVNTPGYSDADGVIAGQSHDYYVVAYDRPRNFGPHSNVATAPAGAGIPAPVDPEPETPAPEPSEPSQPDPVPEPTPELEPSPTVDSTPPAAVAGLRSTAAAPGRVALAWLAPEDDIRGYNLYRDDAYITTVNGATDWVDTGLPSSATEAVYQIVAFDTAGNFSPYSEGIAVVIGETDPIPTPTPTPGAPPEPVTPTPVEPATPPAPELEEGGIPAPNGDLPAPTGLSVRLTSLDWVELQWEPVDGAVAYNVYRDGTLLYAVDSTKTGSQDQRYAKTTSYVDCDYTRFLVCIEQAPDAGGAYTYAVTALDAAGGESAASDELDVQLLQNERLDVQGTLADFTLVFEDDFDGGALDPERWNTRLPWGPDVAINGEQQYFVDTGREPDFGYDPFVFTDDTLRITPIVTPPELAGETNGQPFLSGAITTRDSLNFSYGYVEARMKVARGRGKLSSFFLFHQYAALNAAEIDIAEYLGERPDSVSQNYHWRDERDDETQHPSPTMFEDRPGEPFHADFHTYGVLWEPNLVVWTIDGEEILRLSGPEVSRQASYVVLYLVTGSTWTEAPDPNDPDFAVPLEIDWLRVWQRPSFIR